MTRLLTSVAAIAMLSGAAAAADLPLPMDTPVLAPVAAGYSWTGFYAGLQAGWKWGDNDFGWRDDDDDDPFDFDDGNVDFDGWFAGAHVGGRYQWNWLVAGVEGDLEFVDVDGDFGWDDDDDDDDDDLRLGSDIDWEGSIRGTLGVGFDRVHIYGTGGLAFAGVSDSFDFDADDDGDFDGGDEDDETRIGWTLGAGVDVAVTDRFTVGALYKYVDLGDGDEVDFDGDDDGVRDGRFDADIDYHSIQARVAVKF